MWRPLDAKATSQAESDQAAIDHPEIIGWKGISEQRSDSRAGLRNRCYTISVRVDAWTLKAHTEPVRARQRFQRSTNRPMGLEGLPLTRKRALSTSSAVGVWLPRDPWLQNGSPIPGRLPGGFQNKL